MPNQHSKQLMKNEIEMLDALFRHATEGIIISDTKGKITMINPIVEKQFGYEKNELIGKSIDVLVPDRYTPKHETHRLNYSHNPHPRAMGSGMSLFAKRKDGSEFPVEISLSTFSTSEGTFVMSFIIDNTLRKKHEEEIKKAHEEIKKLYSETERKIEQRTEELAKTVNELAASKQEAMRALEKERELNNLKSRFITTASHEFRTPLAAILSSVSLISKYNNPEDDEKRQKHVHRIKSAVSNLTEILNDFLSLSKLEEGVIRNNPAEFNLSDFIKSIIEEIKSTAKEKQVIVYNHSGTSANVVLDKQLLKNITINLLSNAIKYTPPGKKIELYTEQKNKSVLIRISDQGIGIPEEDQHHLFERFFRANNATNIEGTGLGLNIVKKYVELMNGKINFNSVLNEGTVFTVILPQ